MSALDNNSRETWLHGWPRSKTDVIIGTGVYCIGCGKDHGIITVAIPEGWEHWLQDRPYPDFPFNQDSCPVCWLWNKLYAEPSANDSDYIQVGKDGIPVRSLKGRLPQ